MDGSTDVSPTPALDWGDSENAQTYTLLVDDDPAFGSPEIQTALGASSYGVGPGDLSTGVTYYWKVTAENAAGSTEAANSGISFTTVVDWPEFSLVSPSDGEAEVTMDPRLDWTDLADVVSYELVVDDSADFSSPVIAEAALTDSHYDVAYGKIELGTTYYWKVTATTAAGQVEAMNNRVSFTTVAELGLPLDYLGGGCAPRAGTSPSSALLLPALLASLLSLARRRQLAVG